MSEFPQPGAVVEVRSTRWKVLSTDTPKGYHQVTCRGLTGMVRNKEAHFIWELEDEPTILDPAKIKLVSDESPGFIDTKLHLEAAFRRTPTTTRKPLTLGKAAIDDLKFQHVPVEMALSQERVRLLIADDVGLGKTFEAGLITAELILRGRANRILVVTTRAMLNQFQKDFWTRFSIPLSRLDSAAIRRMRNRIPAHCNVFDQFDRAIISIDTLKRDAQIRDAIKNSYWDLIIIDEAHNAASRHSTTGTNSQRAKLAKLLSHRTDSLLLLTATPHDGSQASFASLIEMLDPTRVPDPENLRREDIEDLVVRRFRSTKGVANALEKVVPKRKLIRRDFALSPEEEIVYQSIADLRLDLDEERPQARAIDLFRITLAKAIFSSPVACLQTLDRRIKCIENDTARGTKGDLDRLKTLADQVSEINTSAFSKYQDLLVLLRDEMRWTGKKPRDRLVIFSERIATATWLAERLREDIGLSQKQVARIDGGGVEADERIQNALEDFGQKPSPLRVLIASDMASEGLNLHYQCHWLIHFDLPWSLLRFQQRNGRIDRYGQDRPPKIVYFIGKGSNTKISDMKVLEKLVEKDIAAQAGVHDPAVFRSGSIAGEEADLADEIDGRPSGKSSLNDQYKDILGGEYSSPVKSGGGGGKGSTAPKKSLTQDLHPPRLFRDTFCYTIEMVDRLSRPRREEHSVFQEQPDISRDDRLIRMKVPNDMRARDSFGFASYGTVDSRYMPPEAVGRGGRIELTDDSQIVNKAIDHAKMLDQAWPEVQFLWDCHPILEWFADRTSGFFPDHAAPVASLTGILASGEVVVIVHGAIPNENGAPIIDRWAAMTGTAEGVVHFKEVNEFLNRTRLYDDTPNRVPADLKIATSMVPRAVKAFQSHLVELRKERAKEINESLTEVVTRLSDLEIRYLEQLSLRFGSSDNGQIADTETTRVTSSRERKKQEIEHIFESCNTWFDRTRRMASDPNPHVDVIAVFTG